MNLKNKANLKELEIIVNKLDNDSLNDKSLNDRDLTFINRLCILVGNYLNKDKETIIMKIKDSNEIQEI